MKRFRGSLVALPTPFRGDGLDMEAFLGLVRRQVAAGTDGLVVCGTTGETPTLDSDERTALVAACVAEVNGAVAVLAGAGTNSTRGTRAEAVRMARAGADGLLVVTPYYNRPSQEGLQAHYAAVADATDLPVVLYNVPARTGVDLLPDTVARIAADRPSVVGIKEATPSLARLRDLLAIDGLDVLCGDDGVALEALELGVAGWVGVVGNLVPAEAAAAIRGGAEERRRIGEGLAPLLEVLALGTNPVAVKEALERQGLAPGEVRAPLCRMARADQERVEALLEVAGLLAGV